MVRNNSGSVVAAAVAVLEQQSQAGPVLRRAGAVSVLPRHSSTSTTDSEAEVDTETPVASGVLSGGVQDAHTWSDSAQSSTSEGTTSVSDSDDNRDEQNTTRCDEDFQWVQNCEKPAQEHEMQPKYNDLYADTSKDPGKPVPITCRSKSSSGSLRGNRTERDNKSKSSRAYTRYLSPSRNVYAEDIFRPSSRNMCSNCTTSCQDIPNHPQHYGSTPGLDCHWLGQPLGYLPCHHRNPLPYFCDQIYPQYRYFKVSPNPGFFHHVSLNII